LKQNVIPLIKKLVKLRVAITEMYRRIPWELVADTLGSAEYTLGTVALGWSKPVWVGHVACLGDKRNAYIFLVGMPEGAKQFGMLGLSWVVNIKVNLTETRLECVDWIHLAQDRETQASVNMVMNLRVP
jgi:hypothetical protein